MNARVKLGRTNLDVSPICYGTWQLSPRFWGDQPEDQMIDALRHAREVGVNFFDTADAYGDGLAETVMGKAFKGRPRDEMIIATKVYWHFADRKERHPDLSRNYILEACEASLRRLQMSYVDLYQIHAWDPLADMDEMIEALELLKRQGKIRHYGVSNWSVPQMMLGHACRGDFATHQPVYSLLKRDIENDVLPYCQAHDMGVLVYSPLHKGLLTGKYKGEETFDDLRKGSKDFEGERFKTICDRVAKVGEIAQGYGMTTVQMMLAVTLRHPGITCAIAGIKSRQHIEEAAGAMGKQVSLADAHAVRGLLKV